jgi:hypothetical protein
MRVGRSRHVPLCQYLLFIRLRLARHVTVPLEQVLDAFSSEEQLVLGLVLVFTRGRNLVSVVVVVEDALWNERGLDLFFHELDPWEVLEPWMFLDLNAATLSAESVHRLTLNHLTLVSKLLD